MYLFASELGGDLRVWTVWVYSWHTPITMTIIPTPFAPLAPWQCRDPIGGIPCIITRHRSPPSQLLTVKFKLLHNTSFQCKLWAHPVWNKSEYLVQLSSLITLQWDIPPTLGPQNECSPAGWGPARPPQTISTHFLSQPSPAPSSARCYQEFCGVVPLCHLCVLIGIWQPENLNLCHRSVQWNPEI